MSESVPSSVTGFANRRSRADSTASFTYFEESQESPEWIEEEAVADEGGSEEDDFLDGVDHDLESAPSSPRRRKSSGFSRLSVEDPLLYRNDSTKTDTSGYGRGGRTTQKIYIVTEDLTVVVAGFSTSLPGFVVYVFLCTVSIGICFLLFRWLPRWRVRLIGCPKPLRECTWVAVEVSLLFDANRCQRHC